MTCNKWNTYWSLPGVFNILTPKEFYQVVLFVWNAILKEYLGCKIPKNRTNEVWEDQLSSYSPDSPSKVAWMPWKSIWARSYESVSLSFFSLDDVIEVRTTIEHWTNTEKVPYNNHYDSNHGHNSWKNWGIQKVKSLS